MERERERKSKEGRQEGLNKLLNDFVTVCEREIVCVHGLKTIETM